MANLLDYLHWRGDLRFSQSPCNEIDATIFAMLSYVNMSGIVPGSGSDAAITIKEMADQVFLKYTPAVAKPKAGEEIIPTLNTRFNTNLEDMLKMVSICPRYQGVRISGFEENLDTIAGQQFAAVVFTLQDCCPEHVVAFRGTDNTLVGWKEDFGIVYMEQIPAQNSAQRYLQHAMEKYSGRFAVCGHSKGGNLAVYAGSHIESPHQDRLLRIFNFDGPGFNYSIMDKTPFALCQQKIINIIPEESMIGMLFDSVGKTIVVSSLARYASQHNAFFWNVGPLEFIRGSLGDSAKMLDHILNSWVSDIPLQERQAFLQALFDLLGDTEDSVISKDPLKLLSEIKNVLIKYKQLDKETRALINLVFGSLTAQTKRTLSTTIQHKLPGRFTTGQYPDEEIDEPAHS